MDDGDHDVTRQKPLRPIRFRAYLVEDIHVSTFMKYGEYYVPFNGSGAFPADAVIVYNHYIWWIPYFEIPFLLLVITLGVVGNIAIIGAIVLEKKLKFAGNTFIVNLAVADLIISAFVLPGILANVIMNKNMFSTGLCTFNAIILSMSSIASMYSLMFVSINRYVAIVYNAKYTRIFSRGRITVMVIGVWLWALLITIPPAFGWGDYRYHKKIHVCMYDCNAEKFYSFTISYVCLSIILPFLVTCFCYYGVFKAFEKNKNKVRKMTISSTLTVTSTSENPQILKDRSRKLTKRRYRERRLVITLFAAVTLFTICWLPYALLILIDHKSAALYKRSTAWLAFTNSAMNSVLYGVLNRNFRNGYRKIWIRISTMCVFTAQKNSQPTSSHASMMNSHDLRKGSRLESEALEVTRLTTSQRPSIPN